MNLIKKILLAQATVLALWTVSAQANIDESTVEEAIVVEIAQRIKPVAVVCVEGDECDKSAAVAGAADTGASTAAAGRDADAIINQYCSVCHATGLVGAPIIGETVVWQERADAQGGIEGLLATSISGINAMPPKGTCSDCTDDELLSAIKAMSGL